ncbi:hypothetical protein KUF71_000199 [Frankliniella fusca]|uniref:Uncharacterized protein n=1 Tax=Frankliniella fusca TaxID=407009 RepID=A0AAE1HD18_9NEOP|nr:hypothetical protein KUF71_026345 [Frankliniella fusca]KAK3923117.1 hypothetical protein KUF71_000199 [Frankliniella fusca]
MREGGTARGGVRRRVRPCVLYDGSLHHLHPPPPLSPLFHSFKTLSIAFPRSPALTDCATLALQDGGAPLAEAFPTALVRHIHTAERHTCGLRGLSASLPAAASQRNTDTPPENLPPLPHTHTHTARAKTSIQLLSLLGGRGRGEWPEPASSCYRRWGKLKKSTAVQKYAVLKGPRPPIRSALPIPPNTGV